MGYTVLLAARNAYAEEAWRKAGGLALAPSLFSQLLQTTAETQSVHSHSSSKQPAATGSPPPPPSSLRSLTRSHVLQLHSAQQPAERHRIPAWGTQPYRAPGDQP
ncbi:hypothetical protein JZ751_017336 [Albula glossodonta]|uniref:Uncharacterized protein n=1 Tax=Albula glossodonta TaxID=121402 RepID=A0A8T2PKM5_9TELE|nr:hypothetical protein JZ751_017336 [Albula glossodonta]